MAGVEGLGGILTVAESLSVYVSAIEAISNLGELKVPSNNCGLRGTGYALLFAELEILQAILSESAQLLGASHSTKQLQSEEARRHWLRFKDGSAGPSKRLRATMDTLRISILLFRDIATNYETQRLLRSQYAIAPEKSLGKTELPSKTVLSDEPNVQATKQDREATKLVSERDFSVFEADVRFKDLETFYAKGKIDTGSDVELVSLDLLQRNNLVQHTTKQNTPITLKTLDGGTFTLDTEITLIWSLPNTPKTYQTTFYVKDVHQFDLLIGKKVVQDLDLLNRNRDVLFQTVLRMARSRDKAEEQRRRAILDETAKEDIDEKRRLEKLERDKAKAARRATTPRRWKPPPTGNV
ncbi:hypothetical protein HRR90_002095 [Exophiala dermatitidis]|nr:hypothetical protein HRR73_002424 [Exophiala dermatitidis]KAJ4537016.1 hypothetical protein HRR76_005036 [Exophiala dermatitidis]KAJ4572300.1 hypothetical protein HRR79_003501 [Exophiala dermatitidis]KAJ4604501.1 hypothetical protein HRR84_001582 [Exophiala dermatitidis]KAJ4619126.1 hypothetical protein HRR85_002115 [Exophiala dermatitidis]